MREVHDLVVAALRRYADRVPHDPADEGMRLDTGWWLTGRALLTVAEDLAPHLAAPLDAEDLLDVLLTEPTLRGLLALVRRHWAEEAGDAA